MCLNKLLLASILLGTGSLLYAQNPTDKLLKINDSVYNVNDFERLYNKNIDLITDKDHKDISKYLELYKLYKLRLQLAYKEKYHERDKITFDYNNFRKEAASNYFIDKNKLEFLVNQALERSKHEIKASHILIQVDEFADAKDTLLAYNKALAIKREIENGLTFESAAIKYSDDLSAAKNNGNLGYFSVFRMVYPFENGAYETNVGTISKPIRSNFGYHLIKVTNKRATPKVKTIAHILIDMKHNTADEAKNKINDIYTKLQKGQNFDDLAFHFSDDIYTRDQYGNLGVYNEGNMDIDGISDVVYDLNFKDAFSQPFLSQYGWHIVKVTSIKNLPSDNELRATFLRKVKSDQRSKILEIELVDHLKNKYNYQYYKENLSKVVSLFDRENMLLTPEIPNNNEANAVLATFANDQILVKDILQHVYSFPTKYAMIKTDELLIKQAFDFYLIQRLKETYNANLENYFPEFAQSLKEYKEGLLLFDLLEDKIWKVASNDSLAVKNFYDNNLHLYQQKPSFIGEVYVFESKREANEFNRIIKANLPFNHENFNYKYKYQGTFYEGDKRLPLQVNFANIKNKVVQQNNLNYVFKIREFNIGGQQAFDQVKNKVIADYQSKLEQEFNKNLLDSANISVNEKVLNELLVKYRN